MDSYDCVIIHYAAEVTLKGRNRPFFEKTLLNNIQHDKHELIISKKGQKDRRQRFLQLSRKGQNLVSKMEPIWQIIRIETEKLQKVAGKSILQQVTRLENDLNKENMYSRVMSVIKKRQYKSVKISEYNPKYKKYFKTLNYVWLKEYFSIEPHDEEILSDPQNKIIKNWKKYGF